MEKYFFVINSNKLLESRRLLQIRPVHKKQQENFDRVLKCVTHLIYLLVATAKTDVQIQKVCLLLFRNKK